jgi:hypothetical protein
LTSAEADQQPIADSGTLLLQDPGDQSGVTARTDALWEGFRDDQLATAMLILGEHYGQP